MTANRPHAEVPDYARRHAPTSRRSTVAVVTGAAVLVAAVALAVALTRSSSPPTASGGTVAALQPTGERNAMGMPVLATPGRADGTASAGAVTVTGANWALGDVPLNVAVRPQWILTNTGSAPVTFGDPHAQVIKGCCPGAFALSTKTLQPGSSGTLSFELSMHPGMDGPHDIAVHVPVTDSAGQSTLALDVTGNFHS